MPGNCITNQRSILSALITAPIIAGLLSACSAPPPDEISDAEAASIYGKVLEVAREELGVSTGVPLHPYIAVVQDSNGYARAQLDEFEFARSAPLTILQKTDSTLVFCEYRAQGICASSSYLVLSQIRRMMDRDASVVVLAVDTNEAPALRYLLVELRYARQSWRIVDTQLAT